MGDKCLKIFLNILVSDVVLPPPSCSLLLGLCCKRFMCVLLSHFSEECSFFCEEPTAI